MWIESSSSSSWPLFSLIIDLHKEGIIRPWNCCTVRLKTTPILTPRSDLFELENCLWIHKEKETTFIMEQKLMFCPLQVIVLVSDRQLWLKGNLLKRKKEKKKASVNLNSCSLSYHFDGGKREARSVATVHFVQFVILSRTCLPAPCVRTFYDFSTAISKDSMCPRLTRAGRLWLEMFPGRLDNNALHGVSNIYRSPDSL